MHAVSAESKRFLDQIFVICEDHNFLSPEHAFKCLKALHVGEQFELSNIVLPLQIGQFLTKNASCLPFWDVTAAN